MIGRSAESAQHLCSAVFFFSSSFIDLSMRKTISNDYTQGKWNNTNFHAGVPDRKERKLDMEKKDRAMDRDNSGSYNGQYTYFNENADRVLSTRRKKSIQNEMEAMENISNEIKRIRDASSECRNARWKWVKKKRLEEMVRTLIIRATGERGKVLDLK